jgi:hypothetical protein
LKLVQRLSGLAIGLSLICISKWLNHNTTEHVKKLEKSKPLQVTIEKSRSHITKDFYPEFGVEHDLFLEQSSANPSVTTSKISPPSIKITINRNGENINVSHNGTKYCTEYTSCKIASFYRITAGQKHTIHIYIKSIDPKLYTLNPRIEARISRMHIIKGYSLNRQLKAVLISALGFAISIISIMTLAIEFAIQKYKSNKYP